MKRRNSQVTVTDLFCGAGGSSIGAEKAGALLVMAANHWRLAIDTHNTNFPNADHDCADISQVDPRRYPRTDILIASPECTTHSMARGRKPERTLFDDSPAGIEAIERSRVTMWDVVRFAEHHRYDVCVVENVVEIRRWAPFEAWLSAMHALGYKHRPVYMNSMVAHPTPQSRDRIYVVFWREKNRAPDLRFDVPAWCAKHGNVRGVQSWKRPDAPYGKYRTQYLYRCPTCSGVALPYAYPAATAIDWSLPAPRIGDRAKPLADATMRRIKAGLEKYGPAAIVAAAGNTWERPGSDYARAWGLDEPAPTQATIQQHALVVDTAYGGSDGHVRSTSEPMASQTARQTQALIVDVQRQETNRSLARSVDEPLTAQTGHPTKALVVSMRQGGVSRVAPADAAPLSSVVATCSTQALVVPLRTHGRAQPADRSVVPTIVAGNAGHGLLVPAGGTWNDDARSTDEPMRARTSRENDALVTPPSFIVKQYTPRGRDEQMSQPIEDPLGTVTAQDHHSLVSVPFLVGYYSEGGGQHAPVSDPMGTVDTRDRRALVEPAIDVEDCGFRMLEPHEIGAAMAFPAAYKVLGNKRDRVRQYGNAVTPPVMSLILDRAIASLQGREV